MLKRFGALTVVALLAFSGTAHAASYNAAQLQAVLDKAQKAAGPGFAVLPGASHAPAPWSDDDYFRGAPAAGQHGSYVGTGAVALMGLKRHLYYASAGQSGTAALAKTAFSDAEKVATSPDYAGKATKAPDGFKTEKLKGRPVTFFEQSIATTTNGEAANNQTRAFGEVIDGRMTVQFSVDDPDAATAQANVRKWIVAYLKK